MDSETIVILASFGTLLLVNLVSLLCVYTTKTGKEWLESFKKTNTKGYMIFWHFWMCLTGITYWPLRWIEKPMLKKEN